MKKLLTVLCLLLVSVLFFAESLVILQTSDIHGNIFPIDYATGAPSEVGLAKVQTLVKAERTANQNVVLLDTGDLLQGTPFAYYYARIEKTNPNPMIKVMNTMGYTTMTIGNHEFNYGMEVLNSAKKSANFKFLSANIYDRATASPYFTPYTIKDVNGIKVAILGLTTKYIPNWEDPKNIDKLSFIDPVEVAKMYVPLLRKKADVVVVAYHGGFERDLATKAPIQELTGEDEASLLMSEVPGIDVIVTGHQHRTLAGVYDNIAVTQPSNWGKAIGKITIDLDKVDGKYVIKNKKAELVSTAKVTPDKDILAMVQDNENKVQKWLDTPVGMANGDFYVEDPTQTRMGDSALIEFVNKVQMYYTGAKISSTALFTNSIKGWKKGPVTLRDINGVYIYANTLKVIRVTGKDLKDAIEQTNDYWTLDATGTVIVNPKWITPKVVHYNYDMYEGVTYTVNVSKPVGQRITDLTFEGKPVEMDKTYDLVLNNYRAGGGGNYNMFKGKPVIKEVNTEVSELMINYILQFKNVDATVDGNWKVVK